MASSSPRTPFEASHLDPRLLGAIENPAIQRKACELVRLALLALDSLKQLDENLYEEFAATGKELGTSHDAAEGLWRHWSRVFAGVENLLTFCRNLAAQHTADASTFDAAAASAEFEIDEVTGTRSRRPSLFDIKTADLRAILDEIDGLGNAEGPTENERWSRVVEEASAVEYGLSSLLKDAHARIEVALQAGLWRQALAILDETQGTASEGVHALVTSVYRAFVPEADPSLLVPGFLTLLDKALLVRRAIADLGRRIEPLNALLQGEDASLYPAALAEVRRVLAAFVTSPACRAMRAADRWEIEKLEHEIATLPLEQARKSCEGLAKYLESLAAINQREVLIVHDKKRIAELREYVGSARGLIDISPKTATDMLLKAQEAAQALWGRSPRVDRLLGRLEALAPRGTRPASHGEWLALLEEILAALDA